MPANHRVSHKPYPVLQYVISMQIYDKIQSLHAKMDLQYPPNWFLLKDSNLLQIFVQICRALGDEEGCGYQPKYAATLVRVVSSSCVSMFTCVTVYHDCLMIAFARESQNEREMLSHSPLFT